MEISRFIYEEIQYRVGAYISEFGNIKIPNPYFGLTTRSSKKRREKFPPEKYDRHYMRIPLKNPIGLYKKVYHIFEDFLKDWNYVAFTAHRDDREKRSRIYQRGLENMGFRLVYVYICPWDKSFVEYFFARPGYELKKKEIKRLIKSSYGSWKQDEDGYWEEDI